MAFEATLAAADRRWDGGGGGCEALGGGPSWVVLKFFTVVRGGVASDEGRAFRDLPGGGFSGEPLNPSMVGPHSKLTCFAFSFSLSLALNASMLNGLGRRPRMRSLICTELSSAGTVSEASHIMEVSTLSSQTNEEKDDLDVLLKRSCPHLAPSGITLGI
jgi:hypothetical protein